MRRRQLADPAIETARTWVLENDDNLFLPVMAIAEISIGIGRLEASGAIRKAADLVEWLSITVRIFVDRILDLDTEASLRMRVLAYRARSAGVEPGFADLAIAAIAMRHDLTIATRNTRHLAALGVATVDPFAA